MASYVQFLYTDVIKSKIQEKVRYEDRRSLKGILKILY